MNFKMNSQSITIFNTLEIIDPMIQDNFDLESHYKILKAFKELDLTVKILILIYFNLNKLATWCRITQRI
jgi:hypothetical protein